MDKYLSRSIDQTLQERKDNPRRKLFGEVRPTGWQVE